MKAVRDLVKLGVFAVGVLAARGAHADEPSERGEPVAALDKPAAPAPPARKGFGQDGHVVFDELLGFGVSGIGTPGGGVPLVTGWIRYENSKSESQGMTAQVSTVAFAPSFDVFVAPRLSLGGQLTAAHSDSRQSSQFSSTTFGGALRPRIGWVVPITEDLAFWPRAFGAISYSHSKTEASAVGVGSLGALGGVSGLPASTTSSQGAVGWGFGLDMLMAATVSKTVALTFGPTISYGKLDASGGSAPFGSASRTSISAAVHGGIALVF
jgi:hypothetical protein